MKNNFHFKNSLKTKSEKPRSKSAAPGKPGKYISSQLKPQPMRKSILLIMSIVAIISCQTSEEEKKPLLIHGERKITENRVTKPIIKATRIRDVLTEKNIQHQVKKNENELLQLLTSLNMAEQKFTLEPGRIVTIKAAKGTQLTINPADLVTIDGKIVTGAVNVVLKEYPGKLDMLKANSQTVSNGRLLVSGGSYYIEMSSNNIPLKLREGKAMQAYFPGMKQQGMEIFYGSKSDNGTMSWVRANETGTTTSNTAPNWKFLNYMVTISPGHLDYFAELEKAGQLKEWKYDIDDRVRKKISDEIKNAKFSNVHGLECFGVMGYYFATDDCMIYLDKSVLSKESDAPLSNEELQSLKNEIDCYDGQLRERVEQRDFTTSITTSPQLKKFGWINCDRFYTDTSIRKDFLVTLKYPGQTVASSVSVFMIFKSMNSLMNGDYRSVTSYSFNNIPSRGEVALVAITKVNGKIMAGKTSYFNLAESNNYEIRLQEITAGQLDPFINSL
jgi:hypothetical protein